MTDRIVIITGGRDLTDRAPIWAFLDEQLEIAQRHLSWLVVYEGGCETGGDLFAREWAERKMLEGVSVFLKSFPPDIGKHGSPAAYHIRNREMVSAAVERRDKHESTVTAGAFPGKRNGTRKTIELLEKAGIETRVVEGCR